MNPIRSWWKEDLVKTQSYYRDILQKEGQAPQDCTPEIAEQILSNHLNTRSMLTIIPFQDWVSINAQIRQSNETKERINQPANPKHYWRYRMHISLEDLLNASELNTKISGLIQASGR
jgi:4-alpha-glucanotransferase